LIISIYFNSKEQFIFLIVVARVALLLESYLYSYISKSFSNIASLIGVAIEYVVIIEFLFKQFLISQKYSLVHSSLLTSDEKGS